MAPCESHARLWLHEELTGSAHIRPGMGIGIEFIIHPSEVPLAGELLDAREFASLAVAHLEVDHRQLGKSESWPNDVVGLALPSRGPDEFEVLTKFVEPSPVILV